MSTSSGYFTPIAQTNLNPVGLTEISTGGTCSIWMGIVEEMVVAFKALREEYRCDLVRAGQLKREFLIGRSLKHPGIRETFAWVDVPSLGPSIMMEWIDGSTLETLIREGSISTRESRRILADLCDAVDYIHHKQTVHRDLKPENILITSMGLHVKVMDFGLAVSDSILTGREPGGTKPYAAPEVLAGRTGDARSDIYALGMLIREQSPELEILAERCLQEDPAKRPASISEIKKELLQSA